MAGKVTENASTTAYEDTFLKNLTYAASQLEKHGLTGLIEPINNYSIPSYYLNSFSKGVLCQKKKKSSC